MVRKTTSEYHNGYRSSSASMSPSSSSSSSVRHLIFSVVRVLGLILFYWCCSISLTFFNRHLFRDYKFPLSITTLHMAIKFLFAAAIRWCQHRFCSGSCWSKLCGNHQNHDRERIHLPWPVLWRKVAPTGTSSHATTTVK